MYGAPVELTREILFLFAVLAGCLFCFARRCFPAEIVALTAVGLLLVTGVLPIEEAVKVFSNQAALTIACMFVLAAGLEKTGAIEWVGRQAVRWTRGSEWGFLVGLVFAVVCLSAFISNTAIVIVFLPIVLGVCRQSGSPPSRFLIPLSYAAMLGGCCTLIGTSTNLIVSGVAFQQHQRPIGMFEFAWVGVPLAFLGVLYLLFVARRLLPDRETLIATADPIRAREFLTEVVIVGGSSLVGKRLRETPLSGLVNVRILEVSRGGERLLEPIDSIVFAEGDRLLLKTLASGAREIRSNPDVQIVGDPGLKLQTLRSSHAALVEAMIAPRSSLIGQSVRLVNFRQTYEVLILAIHRRGKNLQRQFQDVELQFGDMLFLEGTDDAISRVSLDPNFLVLADAPHPDRHVGKRPLAAGILLGVVLLCIFDLPQALGLPALGILGAAFLGCLALVLTRCLEPREAFRAIGWDIVLLIFGMLAIGNAMVDRDAARWLVQRIGGILSGAPPEIHLSVFYLLTNVLTAFISNNAVAVLMTPIGIQMAQGLGVDPRPFILATAMAASLDFSTPIGYQTNTFVFGAGGYRFSDFVRTGLPLNLLLWAAASWWIPKVFPFY